MQPKEMPDASNGKGKWSCCVWMLFIQVALTVGVFLWIASTFKGCC